MTAIHAPLSNEVHVTATKNRPRLAAIRISLTYIECVLLMNVVRLAAKTRSTSFWRVVNRCMFVHSNETVTYHWDFRIVLVFL